MQDTPGLSLLRSRPRRPGEASFFFFDPAFQAEACKVLPGEYFVHDGDIVIQTVLGSCVAACLVDRGAGIGGMNHFLLPEGDDASARYGAFAMELLINELIKAGARRGSLEAKVFGGAAVIRAMTRLDVGRQNVAFVEQFLAQGRVPIVSRDVLDVTPRRVCLFPNSGRAMVKKLAPSAAPAVANQELVYRRRLGTAVARGGAVELF